MQFNYTEEQQMLADAVERWLRTDYDFDRRRALAALPEGFSADNWARLADLGLLGLNVPEEYGGLGAGAEATLIVMQAFGAALLVEPYVPTAVMAAALLARSGSSAQQAAWLPGLADGRVRFAIAALEPESRYDLSRVRTRACRAGAGWQLDGAKAVVLQGGAAQQIVVSARTAGQEAEPGGIALFIVDRSAPGLTVASFPTIDGLRSAELTLAGVQVGSDALLGPADGGLPLLEWTVDRGVAALCAEAVGAMQKLIELTAVYLRERKQFGQPIGHFQALQHRIADMLIATEQARSMALLAAARVDEPDARTRRRAISGAKVMIGRKGRYVGEQAVQLHGGMGMTDELPIGHYFKRLSCIDMSWGNVEHHLELYGEAM